LEIAEATADLRKSISLPAGGSAVVVDRFGSLDDDQMGDGNVLWQKGEEAQNA
jgi:hypothetical protein